MHKPNPATHNPTPDYIRSLVDRSGLTIPKAAKAIGIADRTLRDYCNGTYKAAYPVQFALESLPEQQ